MTRPAAAEHMAELLPNVRPFRVDSGHLSYWELPGDVAEVVEEFASHVALNSMGPGHKSTVTAEQ
jgi:hypothetical protein